MNFLDKYKVNNGNEVNGDYYKVYNEKGEFLYNIPTQQENEITNQFLKGVTCFVINENGEVLLEKRANTELTPGKIDLVSGHIDKDEIAKQSIIRELDEEVGIKQNDSINVKEIATLPLGFESKGKTRNFIITFYYLFTKSQKFTVQTEEVKSLYWVPMEQAFELIKSGKTKFPKQNNNVNYDQIFETIKNAYLNRNIIKKQEIKREI